MADQGTPETNAANCIDTSNIVFCNPKTNSPIKCGCGGLAKLKEMNRVAITKAYRATPYSRPERLYNVDCKFYLRNCCTKPDCKFLHDPEKLRAHQEMLRAQEKANRCWTRPGYVAPEPKPLAAVAAMTPQDEGRLLQQYRQTLARIEEEIGIGSVDESGTAEVAEPVAAAAETGHDEDDEDVVIEEVVIKVEPPSPEPYHTPNPEEYKPGESFEDLLAEYEPYWLNFAPFESEGGDDDESKDKSQQ